MHVTNRVHGCAQAGITNTAAIPRPAGYPGVQRVSSTNGNITLLTTDLKPRVLTQVGILDDFAAYIPPDRCVGAGYRWHAAERALRSAAALGLASHGRRRTAVQADSSANMEGVWYERSGHVTPAEMDTWCAAMADACNLPCVCYPSVTPLASKDD